MSRSSFAASCLLVCASVLGGAPAGAADPWLTIAGGEGPGKGKRVVLISGDEEYRSEEALTQLARILAVHHGFDLSLIHI